MAERRHARSESIALSGASWLPPFGSAVQELLNAPVPPVAPLSFVPIDWVQTTFPNVEPVKGGRLDGYIRQLRRTVKDLSKNREVQSDHSSSHSLVTHSLEGMIEAYMGLNESVREMIKFHTNEMREAEKEESSGINTTGGGVKKSFAPGPSSIASRFQLPSQAAPLPQKPQIKIDTDAAAEGMTGMKITITPSNAASATTTASGSTTSSSTPTGGAAEPESPYTPKVYTETPSPSMVKRDAATPAQAGSMSTSAVAAALANSSGGDIESKLVQRNKKQQDLMQDSLALLAVKKHCVRTLRALRNLHVLVCGIDTLKDILTDKEYQCARLAFQATTEIFHTLTLYSKLPILNQLNDHVEVYKAQLRKDIFQTFREAMGQNFVAGTPKSLVGPNATAGGASSSSNPNQAKVNMLSKLHHCCRLIDLLYSGLEKKELVKWWVTVQLSTFTQMVARKQFGDPYNPQFLPNSHNTVLSGFDVLEKQFSWIWNELKVMYDGEYVQVFPSGWYVDALYTRKWFELIRAQVCVTLEMQEKRIKEENETRFALAEAKKARAIQNEINRMNNAGILGGHGNTGGKKRPGANNAGHDYNDGDINGTDGGNSGGKNSRPNTLNLDAESGSSELPPLSPSFGGENSYAVGIPGDDKPISFDFYKPLLRTIEFENQMRARWINAHTEASLSEEDLFAILGTVPPPSQEEESKPNPPPYPFAYAGYISSAFHPYLPHMLLSERTRFYNFLEELDAEEQWEVESADISSCHFNAATRLFVMIQKSMERYTKVMPGDCFLDLFKEYRTGISNYIELLSKHLPNAKRLEEEEVQSICATLNTNDYIQDRCTNLVETVVTMLSQGSGANPDDEANGGLTEEQQSFLEVLREQVTFANIEEQVAHLNNKAAHVLGAHIVKQLEPSLSHMKEKKSSGGGRDGSTSTGGSHSGPSSLYHSSGSTGGTGGSSGGLSSNGGVVDENKYVREIISVLRAQLGDKPRMSSFAYLCQVVAQDFLTLYYQTLRKCAFKITESIAQQLLLDLQSLKNFLIHGIPEMKTRAMRGSVIRASPSAGGSMDMTDSMHTRSDGSSTLSPDVPLPAAFKPFVKLVNLQALPSENLLKCLTSPNQHLIATYRAIFPKAPPASVYEVLGLRGLSSSEQEKLVKTFNATLKNPADMIPIQKKDFFGNVAQLAREAARAIQ